ncbi:hypothetical protein EZV62_000940 [Acer yangbiense]|uniref:Leucine zipper homeobox-associated domain-containing protein n=1 Tax=Acer yangbiense TaxID=1000413 RepID=A0A5C7ISX4_9ROSI|nr:hypothetical protein EZV62_000940 [Acer yangbiense]
MYRSKLKQTEMECEYLKRWFGSLTEQNRRLREVEELRAMKHLSHGLRCIRLSSAAPPALVNRQDDDDRFGLGERAQIRTNNSALIAMIADEDTITGFLLAGVGNVDLRRKTNYLIVDSKTTVKQIEDAFKEFTTKDDIGIVLISQYVANMIRFVVDSYNKPIPAILEIPSKDHPYDPAHDSVLSRVKHLFSSESVASERR